MTPRSHSFSSSEAAAFTIGGEPPYQGFTAVKPQGDRAGLVDSVWPTSSKPRTVYSAQNTNGSGGEYGNSLPPVLQQLQGVGVIELLEQDDRPTFIIDLADPANFSPGPLQVIFINASLRAAPFVSHLLSADTTDPRHSAGFSRFKSWVISFVKDNESMDVCLPSLSFGGISWTCSTLRRRFRLVSGNVSAVSMIPTSPTRIAHASSILDQRARGPMLSGGVDMLSQGPESDHGYSINGSRPITPTPPASHIRSSSEPTSKLESAFGSALDVTNSPMEDLAPGDPRVEDQRLSFDWTTVPLDTPNIPAHIRFARSVDWASTPLGPMDGWPEDLRSMSNMIMGSSRPAAIYWGPEFIAIYNEAYVPVAGQKHPRLMGMKYQEAWPELWPEIGPKFEQARTSCQPTTRHDDRLLINRHGYLEETYFNWSIVPLFGSDGSVVALYNPTVENTRRKVNERRTLTLHELGEKTSQARDARSFWAQVRAGLEPNESDVPFALIYSVSRGLEETEENVTQATRGETLSHAILQGALGVPLGHSVAVPSINWNISEEGFAPYMRESMAHSASPVVLRHEDGTLPAELIDGLAWRGTGDPCRTVVIVPIRSAAAGETLVGFIVLGINPRRTYDDDDELFVNLLSRQIATSLVSVVLFEEEIRRGREAAQLAALDRQHLSRQLHLRTQQAVESEYRFTRMAEFAPVGMFIADAEGKINYCNDKWWEISRHPRSTNSTEMWMQSIQDEDRAGVEEVWTKLVHEKIAITHEFRFRHAAKEGHGEELAGTWVLMSAYPEKDETGGLKSIFGCITDITAQKHAEDFEKQRREEAVEMKRQQENFIDITSHEMRNPLSAILQCADEIKGGLKRFRRSGDSASLPGNLGPLLDNYIEAANTISLCANHQKRIVDDVLTLSKLDSQLILVTPVDARPVVVVEKVLRMFEAELRSHDIKGEFRIDQSYLDLGLDWYRFDPSRLRQVIINLMTNAIRVTQGRERREIVISLGASISDSEPGFSYSPSRRTDSADLTDGAGWGEGEKINLHLAVSDTGPGLDEDEKNILFRRFSQATPRTHVKYGGSGLGLFICRTLAELQGGQIGVRSTKGEGSTFAFYVRSRRAQDPPRRKTKTPGSSNRSPDFTTSAARLQYSTTLQPPPLPPPIPGIPSMNIDLAPARDDGAPSPLDILIVEDNLVNQKVLQRQLRISGSNTHVANHGGEALEVLRRSRFWNRPRCDEDVDISVILMDLEMPVMDGMTCARKIRELEREGTISKHIPILAVTAYARREQIANAKDAGIDDVISKPFRIRELIPKIEELVAKCTSSPPSLNGSEGLDTHQPRHLRPQVLSLVRNPTY